MSRKALVIGSAGQDGRLLCELLNNRGYQVLGLTRTGIQPALTAFPTPNVDITDPPQVRRLVAQLQPAEIYFLAAHHHSSEGRIPDSENLFSESFRINTLALAGVLEAISATSPQTRLFYAASSLIFGSPPDPVQDENTPLNPNTVYGITKASGLLACRYYRHNHGVYASVGILYNHESPLRDKGFVSTKIAGTAARIKKGLEARLVLGDLDAMTDWGYAPDYVDAMHRVLAAGQADDFVIATGDSHTVREFAEIAFDCVGLDYSAYVVTDAALMHRRNPRLVGNPAKLKRVTGWKPTVNFAAMVRRLVQAELDKY